MPFVRILAGVRVETGTTADTVAAGEVAAGDALVKTASSFTPNARVVTDSPTVTWDWSTPGIVKAVATGAGANSGTATLDFGAAPGTNIATVAVMGQTTILAGSNVRVWVQGNDATSAHNAYEHRMLGSILGLGVSSVTAGVGFTITGTILELPLTGTVAVRWAWE